MNPAYKNYARLGGKLFAVSTVVRQVRKARYDGDWLRLVDAIVNALAVLTAVAIIVREMRHPAPEAAAEAVEEAPL